MPPALTPALALEYVRDLSADVRHVLIFDAAGAPLAGPPALVGPARALLSAAGDAAEVEAVRDDGVTCAVRSASHAAVAVCGRLALPAIVRNDLRAALAALEGGQGTSPPGPSGEPAEAELEAAAEALISASQRHSAA